MRSRAARNAMRDVDLRARADPPRRRRPRRGSHRRSHRHRRRGSRGAGFPRCRPRRHRHVGACRTRGRLARTPTNEGDRGLCPRAAGPHGARGRGAGVRLGPALLSSSAFCARCRRLRRPTTSSSCPCSQAVGLAIVVADAPAGLRRVAHWTTKGASGAGVVREVCERILRAQGRWASTLGEIWRRWD